MECVSTGSCQEFLARATLKEIQHVALAASTDPHHIAVMRVGAKSVDCSLRMDVDVLLTCAGKSLQRIHRKPDYHNSVLNDKSLLYFNYDKVMQ